MARLLRAFSAVFIFISIQSTLFAGVVFTIDSTDKQTDKSAGSLEVLVEGSLLKMTIADESVPAAESEDANAMTNTNPTTANTTQEAGGNVLGSMKDMAIAQMDAQLQAGTISKEQYRASMKMINQTFKPVNRTWGKDIDHSKIKRPKTVHPSNPATSKDTAMDSATAAVATTEAVKTNSTDTVKITSNTSKSKSKSINSGKNSGENSNEMIYRSDRREMVVVDHETKTYFTMSEDFLTTMKDRFGMSNKQTNEVSGMMAQAYQSALAGLDAQNLDPKQRAIAEQMIKNTLGIESQPTGSNSSTQTNIVKGNTSKIKIDGKNYTAQTIKVFRGKTIEKELMIVDFKQLVKNTEERKTLKDYFNLLSKMSNLKGSKASDAGMFGGLDEVDGFPVVVRSFEGGELDEEWKLKSVVERDIDPDAFEPPSGYILRTMGPQ